MLSYDPCHNLDPRYTFFMVIFWSKKEEEGHNIAASLRMNDHDTKTRLNRQSMTITLSLHYDGSLTPYQVRKTL